MNAVTKAATPAANKPRPLWLRILRGLMWTLTFVGMTVFILASYAGHFSPGSFKYGSLLLLAYPIIVLCFLGVGLLDLLICRRAFLLWIVAFAACLSPLWDFCPLNIGTPSVDEEESRHVFRFMTYNVAAFSNFTDKYPGDCNPTISYIINSGADVVNLQEVYGFFTSEVTHITAAQLDSLHRTYPYVLLGSANMAFLSKYPAEIVESPWPYQNGNGVAVFRVDIDGRPVTVFDVHLQSYNLSDSDKNLFHDLTEMAVTTDKSLVKEVKSRLLSKIQRAAVGRAADTHALGELIHRYGGPNVIVAGDFNDVPGCYSLYTLEDFNLRQVYPRVGFGPMITYNSNRFYFRIDHVLTRGDLKPLAMWRGDIRSSDHYPVFVDFTLKSDSK